MLQNILKMKAGNQDYIYIFIHKSIGRNWRTCSAVI